MAIKVSAGIFVTNDGREFRNVLGQFATGVVAVTGICGDTPAGFTVQSFCSVSLDPPLVSICPAKSSTSWPKVRSGGHFCVNILAADQRHVCDLFAVSGADKFADLRWQASKTGSPVIENVIAYVDCQIETEHDAGDHTIVIGRVVYSRILRETETPLLFLRGGYGNFLSSQA